MDKRDYHLKIYIEYFNFKNIYGGVFLLIILLLAVLSVLGSTAVKEIAVVSLQGMLLLFLVILYLFFPVLFSYYDRKKERFTTDISPVISLDYKPLASGGMNGGIRILAKRMVKFGIVSSEDCIWLNRYKYRINSNEGETYVWSFYTEDKGNELLFLFMKMRLQRISYPLKFSYYPHGHILIDIDLVEGYDYPENFVKRFYEIKEMY